MGAYFTFSNSRILCVDDNGHTCDWIQKTLKASKNDVVITNAKTAREAFTLLNQDDFDLCILEYALPDMTGVQLCSLMRQMGCEVPMLFFTAMNRPIDREKAQTAGANEYLSKPDDLDIFVNAVTRLLSKHYSIHAENTRLEAWPKAA